MLALQATIQCDDARMLRASDTFSFTLIKLQTRIKPWTDLCLSCHYSTGDSRNVSCPLGRNPIRWSKVKLVFEALQTDGGKSLLTPVGHLWPWSDLQHNQKLSFLKKPISPKFGWNWTWWSKVMPVFKVLWTDARTDARTPNGSLSLPSPPVGSTKKCSTLWM